MECVRWKVKEMLKPCETTPLSFLSCYQLRGTRLHTNTYVLATGKLNLLGHPMLGLPGTRNTSSEA